MELIQDDVKIELEDIGEGLSGDYDPEDPDDVPLLRFSTYVRGALRQKYLDQNEYGLDDWMPMDDPNDAALHPDGWVPVADASYCTRLPATLSDEDQQRALKVLMAQLYEPVVAMSAKKAAQAASWTGPDDIDERRA